MLGQGISSSLDIFNYITDGGTKLDENFNCLKNIDDFLLYSDTLQGLEEQISVNIMCLLHLIAQQIPIVIPKSSTCNQYKYDLYVHTNQF